MAFLVPFLVLFLVSFLNSFVAQGLSLLNIQVPGIYAGVSILIFLILVVSFVIIRYLKKKNILSVWGILGLILGFLATLLFFVIMLGGALS